MPQHCAVCYVTDTGFLFPTLASAFEMRRYVKQSDARIYIVGMDFSAAETVRIRAFCSSHGICFLDMGAREAMDFNAAKFNRTHVPPSTLGRFFLARCLPEDINYILYLDGDTLVQSDPAALVNFRSPPGTIAAAEDLSYFRQHDASAVGAKTRSYFAGLGIDGRNGYFNAGVLSAARGTWDAICAEAFEFFRANTEQCLYHDQSALNAVSAGRRVRLSPSWNFITHYRVWGLERSIPAAIYHFAGGEKPWRGSIDPWRDVHARYRVFATDNAHLGLSMQEFADAEILRINRHSAVRKCGLYSVFRNRLHRYRAMMRDVLRTSIGPFPAT